MYQENLNSILLVNDYLRVQKCLDPMSKTTQLAQLYLTTQLEKSISKKNDTKNFFFKNVLSLFR